MKQALLSLLSGLMAGGFFALLKLPIPAPSTISGMLGIVGLFAGYMIVHRFSGVQWRHDGEKRAHIMDGIQYIPPGSSGLLFADSAHL